MNSFVTTAGVARLIKQHRGCDRRSREVESTIYGSDQGVPAEGQGGPDQVGGEPAAAAGRVGPGGGGGAILIPWLLCLPTPMQASVLLDERLGCKDRFSTSLALVQSDDPFAQAARAEAIRENQIPLLAILLARPTPRAEEPPGRGHRRHGPQPVDPVALAPGRTELCGPDSHGQGNPGPAGCHRRGRGRADFQTPLRRHGHPAARNAAHRPPRSSMVLSPCFTRSSPAGLVPSS